MKYSISCPGGRWGTPHPCLPEKDTTFSGRTFAGLAWPQGGQCADGHLVDGLQVAPGRSPFGQLDGERPLATPRSVQSIRLSSTCDDFFFKKMVSYG